MFLYMSEKPGWILDSVITCPHFWQSFESIEKGIDNYDTILWTEETWFADLIGFYENPEIILHTFLSLSSKNA